MRILKQSTAANVMIFMADSSDHITGKTGLTLTVTSSQDGGAFGSISPTVTERGTGWYNLALTTSHTNTLGDLAVHITGTGADPSDFVCRVVAVDLADTVRFGLTALPNVASGNAGAIITSGTGTAQVAVSGGAVTTVTTVTNQLTAAQIATGVWQDTTAGDFATASSIGKSLYTSGATPGATGGLFIAGTNAATTVTTALTTTFTGNLTGSVGSVTGAVGSVTGNVGGNVTGSVGSVTGAVGSVTGNVGGNVTGSVGSVAAGGITSTSFGAGAITATVIATDAIDADALATDAVNEIADGLLGRNVSGGSSTGRTVKQALHFLRNKWVISAGTMTVYDTDDTTSSWTSTITTTASNPVTTSDPS